MLEAVELSSLPGMNKPRQKAGAPPPPSTSSCARTLATTTPWKRSARGITLACSAGLTAGFHPPRVAPCRLTTCVQDTLLKVVERLPSFNPRHEGAFQAYVRTALWNRIRDIARQFQRTGPPDPLDTDMAGKEDSPLDLAIGHETLERYEAALERLRSRRRNSSSRASRWACPRGNRRDVRQAERCFRAHGAQPCACQAGRGDGT